MLKVLDSMAIHRYYNPLYWLGYFVFKIKLLRVSRDIRPILRYDLSDQERREIMLNGFGDRIVGPWPSTRDQNGSAEGDQGF